ncbi:MAG: hypothetical protein P1R74_13710 [Sedimenticola sp.]|nr:hypothetical protein [Sedimenticola sp.]
MTWKFWEFDLFSLFKSQKEVLDEASINWQFEVFAWALREFDADLFFSNTLLVTPTNEHFPGRVDSAEGMASLIFDQVKQYAQLAHWPCQLVPRSDYDPSQQGRVAIAGALRGQEGIAQPDADACLIIAYNPNQVGNPEALIGELAYTLAYYLSSMAKEPPPGGSDNWPHACEILTVFLGFGLMQANTAFNFRKAGCGSCSSAAASRESHLSQYDLTYVLALFTALKSLPEKQVLRHLKKSLRGYFKAALRDILGREEVLERLKFLSVSTLKPETAL